MEPAPHGAAASSDSQWVHLLSTQALAIGEGHAHSVFTLGPGQEAVLVMDWGDEAPQAAFTAQAYREFDLTRRYWEGMADECGCSYKGE
jgi:hypothetical protein